MPIFYAAKNGNKAIIELLTATTRVNIDSKDYYNSTPLSIAARRGHKDVVSFLLPKSQSWNAQDTFGQTALWWAKRNGYFEIADLLLKKYEDNGIIIEEDNLSVTTMLFISNEGNRYCDVCVLDISAKGTYYHCEVCNSGDFDICEECLALKASCLDKSHVLTQRTPPYKTLV
jgi:ankyrin repeat protein